MKVLNYSEVQSAHIMMKKLMHCSDELLRLKEEMKQLSHVSSHHLQEPLRKIQTYSSLLLLEEKTRLSAQGKKYLKKILHSTETVRDRTCDFILFTQLYAREKIRIPANLERILLNTMEDLNILIKQEEAQIQILSKLPVICADPKQIEKLFRNLVSNAIKFHKPEAAPLLRISHTFMNAGKNGKPEKIQIVFEDNGIGFDEKFTEDIFLLFNKNTESEGQGIGLAISRKICNLHGGNLIAESKEGEGSKFIVTLPIRTNLTPHENYNGR